MFGYKRSRRWNRYVHSRIDGKAPLQRQYHRVVANLWRPRRPEALPRVLDTLLVIARPHNWTLFKNRNCWRWPRCIRTFWQQWRHATSRCLWCYIRSHSRFKWSRSALLCSTEQATVFSWLLFKQRKHYTCRVRGYVLWMQLYSSYNYDLIRIWKLQTVLPLLEFTRFQRWRELAPRVLGTSHKSTSKFKPSSPA